MYCIIFYVCLLICFFLLLHLFVILRIIRVMSASAKVTASATVSTSTSVTSSTTTTVTATKRTYSIFLPNAGKSKVEAKKRKTNEPLKILSWNVAGLRACIKKKCVENLQKCDADIIFLQETKCEAFPDEVAALPYPFKYLVPSKVKKGHAGVAMLAREKPLKITYGFGEQKFDDQGRWIHAEYENFHVIGTYVINSDLRNPDANRNKSAGFTDQEREDFTNLLNAGFVDVYRKKNPDEKDCYTYWTYFSNARSRNVGWRIDYFIVSERFYENVLDMKRRPEIHGSDHCPVEMTIKI
uniref:DNA-(apurinic or apyrimidinic site) endonuclease n=1 Tax=Panagrolaimus sp. PS1159 TaxID=55785 RepID=A0AC35FYG7_9BILA